MRRKILMAGVAAVAVAGGGAAIAASKSGSPQEESKAVVEDAAKQLGVTPAKLSSALKKALEKKGHVLEQSSWQIGHANCIEVDPQTGELEAVADIARDGGSAAAF